MWQGVTWAEDKAARYEQIFGMLCGLTEGERDAVANMANASALIAEALENINWAGFYVMKQGMLVLGPFQGSPACIRIALGRGVCGTAAQTGQTQLVPDVHLFPGHIACDARSQSEIVVPLVSGGRVVAVLDIDSPVKGRFDEADRIGLERLAAHLSAGCGWDAENPCKSV